MEILMARFARLTAVAHAPVAPGPRWIERTRDSLIEHLRLAARGKPDLVVFPETLNATGLPLAAWLDTPEPIPGPTYDRIAELAAELGAYVALPLFERQGKHIRNTIAFIDRQGQLLGKYHKHVPTIIELEMGVVPGTGAPGFDTDFGRIGGAICFDLNCPEVGALLAASDVRLVTFVSQFIGGERLLHWPRDYGCYIVSADSARATIVDMAGRFLAETGWEINQVQAGLLPPLASATINMDRVLLHLAYNQDKFPEIIKKYGPGVEIESHYPEAHCTLASVMEDVTVEDLMAEFGLESWVDYINRCRRVRAEHLEKGTEPFSAEP